MSVINGRFYAMVRLSLKLGLLVMLVCIVYVSSGARSVVANEPVPSPAVTELREFESRMNKYTAEELAAYLGSDNRLISTAAAGLLVRCDSPNLESLILDNIDNIDHEVTKMILTEKLFRLDSDKSYEKMKISMQSGNQVVKYNAAVYMAEVDPSALSLVQQGIQSSNRITARTTAHLVVSRGQLPESVRIQAFRAYIKNAVRHQDVVMLYKYIPLPELLEYVLPYTAAEYDDITRFLALSSISKMEDRSVKMPILLKHLDDPSPKTVRDTVGIIARMEKRSEWELSWRKSDEARIPEICQQIKQWWAEESAKARNPDSVQ